jgi:competence/damage-inducible protein CinA-like protein
MPTAEIITIGTELLLGEIQDTNTAYIARCLRSVGVDLYRTQVVGDNPGRVADMLSEAAKRADILICTGGLGPTVDDPTRDALSLVLHEPLEFRPDLWQSIYSYFQRLERIPSENNKTQATLPRSALAIPNLHGTAPGIQVNIGLAQAFFLPGVPREMEEMMTTYVIPAIEISFPSRQVLVTRIIHTAGMGESQLDLLLGEYERMSNPTVGLAAHAGTVDIRITAKANTVPDAAAMLGQVESELRHLLGNTIFGVDDQTLAQAVQNAIPIGSRSLLLCAGWSVDAVQVFQQIRSIQLETLPHPLPDPVETHLCSKSGENNRQTIYYASIHPGSNLLNLDFGVFSGGKYNFCNRKFGGPPANGLQWAINTIMNLMREHLLNQEDE